jgi:hypothetical protein
MTLSTDVGITGDDQYPGRRHLYRYGLGENYLEFELVDKHQESARGLNHQLASGARGVSRESGAGLVGWILTR